MIPCDGNAMRTAPFCLLKKLSFSHIAAFIFSFCSVVCRPPQNAGKYMLLPHSLELSQETMHVKTPPASHRCGLFERWSGSEVSDWTKAESRGNTIFGLFYGFFPRSFCLRPLVKQNHLNPSAVQRPARSLLGYHTFAVACGAVQRRS